MTEKTNEEKAFELTKEIAKEVAKDVYEDIGRPVVKPVGEMIGLVPRAIKAAFEPLEKWVMQREFNIAETRQLLEQKLKQTPPELIESPEPHVAVPALQYISYCMDNNELREMYANLLANSMNSVVKNGVHPGFVEIIKQLSPDEAKFLRYMRINTRIPTLGVNYVDENGSGIEIICDYTNVLQKIGCERVHDSQQYIDNLVRLGLVKRAGTFESLTEKKAYDDLKNDDYVLRFYKDENAARRGLKKAEFSESFIDLTAYGKQFCSICLETQMVVRLSKKTE